uniref:DDE Tnp4 domain-containing protein n=1 Tax=Graphocephala atropunctata TaxID=36148 RepID=A0A1B6K9S4_9HEMI
MDGKHIDIVPPANSGSFYFNYKGRHSMVLLAIVGATYRFLLVDFGTNGRISDGGVLQNTKFYEKLENDELTLPEPSNVTEKFQKVPYVFVADDAFPLTTKMLKPFRQAQLDSADKEIYNYRLSRARHVVENSFGILAARFRIFHTQINLEPENITRVVKATCALHNFLIAQQPTAYAPPCSTYQENCDGTMSNPGLDSSESNMIPLQRLNQGNIGNAAKKLRNEYTSYFVNEGKVSWQNARVYRNKQ